MNGWENRLLSWPQALILKFSEVPIKKLCHFTKFRRKINVSYGENGFWQISKLKKLTMGRKV